MLINSQVRLLLFIILILLIPSFLSFSQEAPILAVTDLVIDKKIENELAIPLTDKIREIFVNSNQYQVVDRNTINLVIEEQKFQLSDLVDEERTVKIGKLLGAQFIVTGNLAKIEELFTMSLRIIDVETGIIVSQVSGEIEGNLNELLKLTERLSNKIVGIEPISERIGSIYVDANMEESEVFLDGLRKGNIPLLIESIQKGYHIIEVKKENYYYKAEIAVIDRDVIEIKAELEILKGNIFIQTEPDKVDIFIDDQWYGQSPELIKNITTGVHKLYLVKDWYIKIDDFFEVKPYETKRIHKKLEKSGKLFIEIKQNVHEVDKISIKSNEEDIFPLEFVNSQSIDLTEGKYQLIINGLNINKIEKEILIDGGKVLNVQISPKYTQEYIEKQKAAEREKEKNQLIVNLKSLKTKRENYKTAGIITGGGAAVSTGNTILFYFLAKSQLDKYYTYYDLYEEETNSQKAIEYRNKAQDHYDRSKSFQTAEYIFIGTAILSAGLSTLFFILRPDKEEIDDLSIKISTYNQDRYNTEVKIIKRF